MYTGQNSAGIRATSVLVGSDAFFWAASSVIAGVIVGTLGRPPAFYLATGLFLVGFLATSMLPRTDTAQPSVA